MDRAVLSLDLFSAVQRQSDIGAFRPVFQGNVITGSDIGDLFLIGKRLIRPVMKGVIVLLAFGVQKGRGVENRKVKHGEAASGDEHSTDDQAVDRLLSLKFHHTSGNDIFVGMFPAGTPSVYHRMEHDHI